MLLAACQVLPKPPLGEDRNGFTQLGVASWYGSHFHGKLTATGERYDMNGLTAAHRTLPLNAYVRVSDLETGRSVVVRINDRGPYFGDRIIDLSARAARELGLKDRGVARVRIDLLSTGNVPAARMQ
jgi:rare lipoprotein A